MLKEYLDAFSQSQKEIKGVNPSMCTQHIYIKEGCKPLCQSQKRMNLTFKDIVKEEMEKLLDVGSIYPITYGECVSPLILFPKKMEGGGSVSITNTKTKPQKRTISLYLLLTKYQMVWKERSSSLSWMDSVVTIKSRSSQRTRINPPSPLPRVPLLIGSFLLVYFSKGVPEHLCRASPRLSRNLYG